MYHSDVLLRPPAGRGASHTRESGHAEKTYLIPASLGCICMEPNEADSASRRTKETERRVSGSIIKASTYLK